MADPAATDREPRLPDAAPADVAAPERAPLAIVWLGLGAAALAGCLVIFGALAQDVHDQEAILLDGVAGPFLHGLASPPLDAVMRAATFLGSAPTIPVSLVIAVIALFATHHRPAAVFLLLAIGGSFAINEMLKVVFHRPRPQLAWATVQTEYSFPSGHSQNGLVFYLALALIAWVVFGRRAGIAAVIVAAGLALLIGTSRIYFGYHYLSDVLAGYAAGLAWLAIVGIAFDAGPLLAEWRRRRETQDAARTAGDGRSPPG
ncbi:MAG TPA: phosphatase PAP2 family protein [Candidatus Dormibacteraeota bacterium]|nr:phosphatase PAP2 family protein [Candidatus Dormibacteraeota bacterium]